jgi:hypothetical protein
MTDMCAAARVGEGFDRHFDILAKNSQKPYQTADGNRSGPTAHQGGHLRLYGTEGFARLGLG